MNRPDAPTLVLGFPEYETRAQALATALGAGFAQVAIHRFPDGESKVTLPERVPGRVILVRSLDHPNDKLVELLLTSATLRAQGARHITLIAPYLCYMRQDIAFHPGEAVSQRIVGAYLGGLCDALITVDPHLHRIHQLSEAVPVRPAVALTAAPLMSRFLSERLDRPLLLGPDAESRQWVAAVAQPGGLDYEVASKTRLGDHQVRIQVPAAAYRGREIVIVDDVASTGHTIATAARQIKAAGAGPVHALVTHPLFVDDALSGLREAGVERIWSTDSIPHQSNALSLSPLLAQAVLELPSPDQARTKVW
jgi:ribose-phosphate pyrophosphokinase